MTEADYYAMVRRLGLKQKTPTVYLNSSGDAYSVPDASKQTPDQRFETIEKIMERLGIAH